jgi:CRP-like cAMP-binding protein
MNRKYVEVLRESPLFKNILNENIDQLAKCLNVSVIEYKKGDIISVEGTYLDGIGVVLEGILTIGKTSVTGTRIVMGTVGSGELFGETAAFTKGREWPATVEASSDSAVLFIDPTSVTGSCSSACEWHRTLQENMLGILAMKALALTQRIRYMAIKGLRAKVCTYLYNLHIEQETDFVSLPLKKYELAQLFNVERPSLSRAMINLRDEGIIDFDGRTVKICDYGKLAEVIGEQ